MKSKLLAAIFCLGILFMASSEVFSKPIIVTSDRSQCLIWWFIVEEDTGEILAQGTYRWCDVAIVNPGGGVTNEQALMKIPLDFPPKYAYLNKAREKALKNRQEIPTGYDSIELK